MAVPVVILAAVDSSRAGETGMDEGGVADATDQAILVPGSVRHSHDVAIRNGQSASFAHLRQPQTSVNIRNHIRIGIRSNRPIRITHQDHPSGSPIRITHQDRPSEKKEGKKLKPRRGPVRI